MMPGGTPSGRPTGGIPPAKLAAPGLVPAPGWTGLVPRHNASMPGTSAANQVRDGPAMAQGRRQPLRT